MNILYFDNSIDAFIDSLEIPTQAKIIRLFEAVQDAHVPLHPPVSKKIEDRMFELRIPGGQSIRFLYTYHSGDIVLLHGFIKKSQRIPIKEIQKARVRLRSL